MPLPHVSRDLQSPEQPSPDTLLPSSHASPVSLMPSPQRGFWQSVRHASATFAFDTPLSHCSPCIGSMIASPQRCSLHVVRHIASAAFEFITPRSHCSPFAMSMMLLPQVSRE